MAGKRRSIGKKSVFAITNVIKLTIEEGRQEELKCLHALYRSLITKGINSG
jgi:hypothetical protein